MPFPTTHAQVVIPGVQPLQGDVSDPGLPRPDLAEPVHLGIVQSHFPHRHFVVGARFDPPRVIAGQDLEAEEILILAMVQ